MFYFSFQAGLLCLFITKQCIRSELPQSLGYKLPHAVRVADDKLRCGVIRGSQLMTAGRGQAELRRKQQLRGLWPHSSTGNQVPSTLWQPKLPQWVISEQFGIAAAPRNDILKATRPDLFLTFPYSAQGWIPLLQHNEALGLFSFLRCTSKVYSGFWLAEEMADGFVHPHSSSKFGMYVCVTIRLTQCPAPTPAVAPRVCPVAC